MISASSSTTQPIQEAFRIPRTYQVNGKKVRVAIEGSIFNNKYALITVIFLEKKDMEAFKTQRKLTSFPLVKEGGVTFIGQRFGDRENSVINLATEELRKKIFPAARIPEPETARIGNEF